MVVHGQLVLVPKNGLNWLLYLQCSYQPGQYQGQCAGV